MLQMNVTSGDKSVNARTLGTLQRFRRPLNIECTGARQRRYLHPRKLTADCIDSLEISLRRNGKTGLQYVHAQIHKGGGHFELLRRGHTASGGLLPIA